MVRGIGSALALLSGAAMATWGLAGTRLFNGFSGSFLRVLLGYAALVGVVHFVYLLLPKLGVGSDPRVASN